MQTIHVKYIQHFKEKNKNTSDINRVACPAVFYLWPSKSAMWNNSTGSLKQEEKVSQSLGKTVRHCQTFTSLVKWVDIF